MGLARIPSPMFPEIEVKNEMDKKLLEILVCPVSKAPLTYDKARQELICWESRLAYPVRDGIPVMLEAEARRLADEEVDPSA